MPRVVILCLAAAGPWLGVASPAVQGASPSAPPPSAAPGTSPALGASAAPGTSIGPSAAPATTDVIPAGASVAWSEVRARPGPSVREDHTWTVDPTTGLAWLFGGRDGDTVHDDLWAFDPRTGAWEEIDVKGRRPEARFGHAAAWVDGIGLVIFGGQSGGDFFGDLWAFDPAGGSWRRLPARGAAPAARYGTCASVGPDGRMWISHGFTAHGRFEDTRAYDFDGGTWRDETPEDRRPPERCLHECFWSSDGRLVLYGGQDDTHAALGDSWALEPDAGWHQLPDPPAPARRLYALAVDDATAWVFGGGGRSGAPLDDLWRIDRSTLGWERLRPPGEAPIGRSAATFVVDAGGGRMLLFGGQGPNARKADLWQLAPAPDPPG